MDDQLLKMQELFRSLALELKGALAADPKATGWTDASLDVRYSQAGTRWKKKLRATVEGHPVSVSTLYGMIDDLVEKIGENRIGEPFYGFVLCLNASGEVEVRFNYDVNAFADPDYWAS
jgi:hypothetical protein